MLGSLARWLEGGLRMSAAQRRAPASSVRASAGRVALRLRVSRSSYAWWRGLEAQARRWLPCGMSWLRFLCLSLWQAWRHLLGTNVAYGQIYIRDRFRCTSPVCSRKDVTPHHLKFRSAGGGDLGQQRDGPVHVVPPLRHTRRSHSCGGECRPHPLGARAVELSLRRGARAGARGGMSCAVSPAGAVPTGLSG